MRLLKQKLLLICIIVTGTLLSSKAQSLEDYPWLNSVIDTENCCENQSVELYRYANTYDFIFIHNDADCLWEGGRLYDANGAFWCFSFPDYDCLGHYNFDFINTIYTCGEGQTSEIDLFNRYTWLNSIVNTNDCCSYNEVTLYRNNKGHEYLSIAPDSNCSTANNKFYYSNGQFYCGNAPNYDCVALYGFSDMEIVATWTCGDGQPEPTVEDITLRNTLQDPGEPEVTYASLFGQADDAYDEFATLSETETEFPTALAQAGTPAGDINGLYSIDLTETSIEFTVLPDESDPFWANVFGLFPEGKFDRYYFTFAEPHNIRSASSNHTSVNLIIESETVVVVEISEGYDLQPGVSFFISLNGEDGLTNEQKARAFNEGLTEGDASVIKWIRNDYLQHNLGVPTGKAPIAGFYGGQPTGITVDVHRSFEVGDYVFSQTTLGGTWGQFFGSNTDNILYEVWRFEDGFAVEHWDNIVPVIDDGDGTTQTDGATTPATDLESTDANQALLEEMAQTLFVDGDWTNVRNYFDLDNYVQHSVGAGPDGAFLASLEGQTGVSFYDDIKFVHTLGNFGLVMSQGGDITGQDPDNPYAYYDLFRMENGKIVEHWDAIQLIPPRDQWANDNGKWGDDAIIAELTNEQKAIALQESIGTGDPAALAYVSDEQYIQHNLALPSGKETIAGFFPGQPTGVTVDIHRSFEIGDYVVMHTTFGGAWGAISGTGSDQVVFDVWRFEDGLAVEHWDNLGNVVDDMDGTTQTDGAVTPASDLESTDANQALLEEMAQTLFVDGDWTNLRDYFDLDAYVQHSVGAGADGAFLATLEGATGVSFYESVKYIHTLGNFGLVMSQGGDITGQDPDGTYAYYDLFRMENGKIVEHWDVIQLIPPQDQWANDNGKWGDDKVEERNSIVIEVTAFNLTAEADASAFEKRDAEIERDFTSLQPGFLKRMSGVDADGKYVVVVFWETSADADASIEAFGMDPTVSDYFAMIDGSTFSAERYTSFSIPNIEFSLIENNVIEVTTFNINDDVDPAVFEARDAEIEQDFTSLQPGFIRRTSGVNADGKYVVVVFWDALADADASIEAFGMDPTVGDYFAMIDGSTFSADRYTIFGDGTNASLNIPENLTVDTENFFPEDITIVNNVAYVSSFADGTIYSFDLTQTDPKVQVFAAGEEGYTQGWGLKSDGTILLNLLNNADFTGNPPGPAKLVQYDITSGNKTAEWDLPENVVGHTVSIVDGKYYVTNFGFPQIFEVDPTSGTITEWFTSDEWDASISGLGGTIYDNEGGFYISQGNKLWYLPISGGQSGTLQEVTVSGIDVIDADGIYWDDNNNTLYYATNDTGDPANIGTAYKLVFSDKTNATGSVIVNGLDDTSGVWYLENDGSEYLFILESQFGGLFGINEFDPPFNIEIIKLN